jgi:hypothetical protein
LGKMFFEVFWPSLWNGLNIKSSETKRGKVEWGEEIEGRLGGEDIPLSIIRFVRITVIGD